MSRKIKTKARKGHFRAIGDKVRDKVTRGKTKGDFLSGFGAMIFFCKKTFDTISATAYFHFIGRNDASDKNQKPHRK